MMAWQDEFKDALVGFLVRNGTPVSERPSMYGWIDYEWEFIKKHIAECGIAPGATWKDSDWTEFAGTFAEPPWEEKNGIDATVSCTCGLLENRVFRYTGSLGELITDITRKEGE